MECTKTDIYKELLLRQQASDSLYEFIKQAWPEIEKGTPFVGGWYIQALCEHLEALYRGDIKNLLVNVPPRTTKTTTCSAMFPAWVWIDNPSTQFLCLSHSFDLAMEASLKHRDIIASEWYTLRWGDRFHLKSDQNEKTKFANDKSGYRSSTSMLSRTTGKGANMLIVDDPNNALESESDRESINKRWDAVLSTRLNDMSRDKRLVIQQRTDSNDLTGHILNSEEADEWTKFVIPMEFEEKRRCKTIILPSTNGKKWKDPRTVEKESLCPIRFNEKSIERLKKRLGSNYLVAGQLQQRPAPEEGGMFRKSWFQWWKKEKPPNVFQIIQSWDTAFKREDKRKANQKISYSACTTWGLFDDEFGITNLILLNLWRDRVEFPELRSIAQKLCEDYRNNGSVNIIPDGKHVPDMILIECKATGDPLMQELRRAGIQATSYDPTLDGDKIRRASLITHIVQSGRVWLPARPPNFDHLTSFAHLFMESCANFPNDDESKDIVDTFSQVVRKVTRGGLVRHPTDLKAKPQSHAPLVLYGNR
jgi:hypothetical protein